MVVRVRPFITYFFHGKSIFMELTFLIPGIIGMIIEYDSLYLIYIPFLSSLLIINTIIRARRMNLAMLDKHLGQMTVSSSIPLLSKHTKVTYPLDEITRIESSYGADELHIILRNGKHIPFADGGYEKAKARHRRVADFLGVDWVSAPKLWAPK